MITYTVTDLGIDADRAIKEAHGSNSQRVSYAICPAQYAFSKIERLPEAPTSDMIRGTTLHAGLAHVLVALMRGVDLESALGEGVVAMNAHLTDKCKDAKGGVLWLPRFSKGPNATFQTVLEDATRALPRMVDLLLSRFTPLTVEHGFMVRLPDCEPTAAFADFVGLDNQTGEVAVLDVKTGAKMKSASDLVEDDALVLYAAGAEDVLHERPTRIGYACAVFGSKDGEATIRVDFVVGADGNIGIPYNPERLKRIATHQRALAAAKAAKLFLPMQTSWACARCSFIDACEERYGPTGISRKGELGAA